MFVLFGFQNRSPAQEHRLDRDNTSRSFCLFLPLFGQAPVIWIARLRCHSFNVNIFIQQEIRPLPHIGGGPADAVRSEEHTSELQSLMRISYAVFCLKQKTKKHN